jgi:hypothetical protein
VFFSGLGELRGIFEVNLAYAVSLVWALGRRRASLNFP